MHDFVMSAKIIGEDGFFNIERLGWNLYLAVMTILVFPIIGFLIGKFIDLIGCIFAPIITRKGWELARNYGTFPGVIHHELSHAIVAFILGAKITKIEQFTLKSSDHLGMVSFVSRGPKFVQQIQICASSVAPVFFGIMDLYLLGDRVLPMFEKTEYRVFVIYIMISIFAHMEMSYVDVKNVFRNAFYPMIIIFILGYVFDFLNY